MSQFESEKGHQKFSFIIKKYSRIVNNITTMFSNKNARLKNLADKAGVELTDDIEFFGELLAEECADIAETAAEVGLPAAPIIRSHFGLLGKRK